MNAYKHGFALIEIIVSIAISSMLSLVLFAILLQVQKSQQIVSNNIDTDLQIMTFYERMQKDLTGMFWPQFMPPKPKELSKSKQANLDVPSVEQPDENSAKGPNIAKIIFSENSRFDDLEILKECSFITSNPLQVYGESKPRVARVIYSLEPMPASLPGSFVLYRQESIDLDYRKTKTQAPKYALISDIRVLNLTYFYQKQNQDQANLETDLIKYAELELDQNNLSNQDQAATLKDLAGRVPSNIKIDLSLWSGSEQKDYTEFEFWFYINNYVQSDTQAKNKDSKVIDEQAK